MSDPNKFNLQYFEDDSMRGLFDTMNTWQQTNEKRLLSTNIQEDNGKFCCIALTNPSEVIIVAGSHSPSHAQVIGQRLMVNTS